MTNEKEDDIAILLERWMDAKTQMSDLESRIEKYKRIANRIMTKRDINIISSADYTLKRVNTTRFTVSKNDLPASIWKEYSKRSDIQAYYLSKNKC